MARENSVVPARGKILVAAYVGESERQSNAQAPRQIKLLPLS